MVSISMMHLLRLARVTADLKEVKKDIFGLILTVMIWAAVVAAL